MSECVSFDVMWCDVYWVKHCYQTSHVLSCNQIAICFTGMGYSIGMKVDKSVEMTSAMETLEFDRFCFRNRPLKFEIFENFCIYTVHRTLVCKHWIFLGPIFIMNCNICSIVSPPYFVPIAKSAMYACIYIHDGCAYMSQCKEYDAENVRGDAMRCCAVLFLRVLHAESVWDLI